jgi:hypothetical protein
MVEACSAAWLRLAQAQDTPPASTAQLEPDSGQAGIQRGRQPFPLMPVIPWDRYRTAAASIAGAGGQNVAGLLTSMESAWLQAQAA